MNNVLAIAVVFIGAGALSSALGNIQQSKQIKQLQAEMIEIRSKIEQLEQSKIEVTRYFCNGSFQSGACDE